MIKEDIKILTDYMLELNNDIQSAEEWANTGADEEMYWAIKNVLEYMEKIEKENEELKSKNKTLEELLQGNLYELYKYYKELAGTYQGNSISVQKIKDRIEKLQKTNFNDYTKEQDGNEVKTKILYEFKKLLEGEE